MKSCMKNIIVSDELLGILKLNNLKNNSNFLEMTPLLTDLRACIGINTRKAIPPFAKFQLLLGGQNLINFKKSIFF